MSRIAFIALAGLAATLSGGAASAGGHGGYYTGYGPAYGGYPQPCCAYAPPPPPPPCCAAPVPYYAPYPAPLPTPLPPPPLVDLGQRGPKYYSGNGYGPEAGPCYRQYVRVPDRFGGWAWGVKHGCDDR